MHDYKSCVLHMLIIAFLFVIYINYIILVCYMLIIKFVCYVCNDKIVMCFLL